MLFYYKDCEIQYMRPKNMTKYAQDQYIDKEIESINKKAFLKDLALFKAFRTEIELDIKNRAEFFSYVSMFLVILSIVLTSHNVTKTTHINMSRIVAYIAIGLLFYIFYRFVIKKKDTKFKKYETVNYIIYNLEFKKEEFDAKLRKTEKNFNSSESLLDENNTTKIKSNLHSKKEMQRDKIVVLNFAKKEHENSLVNKASKISLLILFLFSINKKLNDKK